VARAALYAANIGLTLLGGPVFDQQVRGPESLRLTNELRLRRASAAPENTGARRVGVWQRLGRIGESSLVGREGAPASQL
jgi:hypothetical protein